MNVGQYISEVLPTRLRYNIDITNVPGPDVPLAIIIPVAVVVLLLGILLVFGVVVGYHRKVRVLRNELGWTNVINEIELTKLQHESKFALFYHNYITFVATIMHAPSIDSDFAEKMASLNSQFIGKLIMISIQ